VGPNRRLGTWCVIGGNCINQVTSDGCYCIDSMAAGTYSILVDQPLFFVAPRVVPNLVIPATGSIDVPVELGIDYSTFFKNDWTAAANSVWYQTFVATGTGVRGVAFSYAGNSPSYVQVGLLEDNGDPDVRNWRLVTERIDDTVNDITDNWVRYRSPDAPTVPGRRYAIRLMAVGSNIQPYKRNKDANSYSSGRAYDAAGVAQNFDMNITVFSDNDGTLVTMNKRYQGNGALVDGNFAWKVGQTFVSHGVSLAGVDLWAAGANYKWDLNFAWRLYPAGVGGPSGAQIGPTKITQAGYQAFGLGLHGVSYNPNEVRLVPGRSYFIEAEIVNPPAESMGFNACVMDNDSYDDGQAFLWTTAGWLAKPTTDWAMTIVEYAPVSPAILVDPLTIEAHTHYTGNAAASTFTVTNSGNGTMNYTIEETSPWFGVSPQAGDSAGESDAIQIHYSTAGLAPGSYTQTFNVLSDGAVNSPQPVTVRLAVKTVPPDFDHDTDVDTSDYGHLQQCFSGPGIAQDDPACADARLDDDPDVDRADFEAFLACFSGPDIVADPYCAVP
jgi:hypothetical protein